MFRIGAVARRIGVSVHTLRVWERRYAAVQPSRTEGGDRLYSEADVERLALIRRLTLVGHSVSTIAGRPTEELQGLYDAAISRTSATRQQAPHDELLQAIEELDVEAIERVLGRVAASLSPREIALDFLTPVLREVGARWESGRLGIGHEHLATSSLRRLLSSVTRGVSLPGSPVAVVATPAGERHELGALVVAMLARLRGFGVVYLGADLPASEIVGALHATRARMLLLSIACGGSASIAQEVASIEASAPRGCEIVVGGSGAEHLSLTRARRLDAEQLEHAFAAATWAPSPTHAQPNPGFVLDGARDVTRERE